MILKRYILIFTLALISCAGTNYIHSISTEKLDNQNKLEVESQRAGIDAEESEGLSYKVEID